MSLAAWVSFALPRQLRCYVVSLRLLSLELCWRQRYFMTSQCYLHFQPATQNNTIFELQPASDMLVYPHNLSVIHCIHRLSTVSATNFQRYHQLSITDPSKYHLITIVHSCFHLVVTSGFHCMRVLITKSLSIVYCTRQL